jgi:hypothetical protein
MSQETEKKEEIQLPIPSFTPENVQTLMNYANEKLPTMYGSEILKFVEKIALEQYRATQTKVEDAQVVEKEN